MSQRWPPIARAAACAVLLCVCHQAGAAGPRLEPTPAGAMPTRSQAATLPDFTALVARCGQAVVHIRVASRASPAALDTERDPNPFDWFFRPNSPAVADRPQQGIGSGFIVSSDGVILTNAHVVRDADEVYVRLHDRRELPAQVLGADPDTDVAVLRIDASGLPQVRIGSPAALHVGQWVAALGAPAGAGNTVSAGVVSATSRALPSEVYVPFIQSDVAVNAGNSGGPLLNLAGEVVGINSQIYSQNGGWPGLALAVPIDLAMRVKSQLQADGRIARGRLGVAIQEVDDSLARAFGLPRPLGALVTSVEPTPGDGTSEIHPGDVILAIDAQPVEHAVDLARIIGETRPGTELELAVWREGARRRLHAVAGARGDAAQASAMARQPANGQPRLGVTVHALSAEDRNRSGLSSGLLVSAVTGPAARAGIEVGDVILAMNGTPVSVPADLARLLSGGHKQIALLVQRGTERLFVPVQL